jgi:UDP-N-acetylglucosamine acyltransferase
VGLERRGLSEEVRRALKQAYRLLFQGTENLSVALDRAEREVVGIPEVKHLIQFVRSSERGVTT